MWGELPTRGRLIIGPALPVTAEVPTGFCTAWQMGNTYNPGGWVTLCIIMTKLPLPRFHSGNAALRTSPDDPCGARSQAGGCARGGQRSALKPLLRGEPLHRCWPAGYAGAQRARRGGNPPAPAFPRRGKRERGSFNFLAAAGILTTYRLHASALGRAVQLPYSALALIEILLNKFESFFHSECLFPSHSSLDEPMGPKVLPMRPDRTVTHPPGLYRLVGQALSPASDALRAALQFPLFQSRLFSPACSAPPVRAGSAARSAALEFLLFQPRPSGRGWLSRWGRHFRLPRPIGKRPSPPLQAGLNRGD